MHSFCPLTTSTDRGIGAGRRLSSSCSIIRSKCFSRRRSDTGRGRYGGRARSRQSDPPSDGPWPPVPGSRNRTCAIILWTKRLPIRNRTNHEGLVPRIGPLGRFPRGPTASSRYGLPGPSLSRERPASRSRAFPQVPRAPGGTLSAIASRFPRLSGGRGRAVAQFRSLIRRIRNVRRPIRANRPSGHPRHYRGPNESRPGG